MPHECTNCGRTFPDGSKEMLSGCPDCGGNKFQFTPSRSLSGGTSDGSSGTAPSSEDAAGTTESTPAESSPGADADAAAVDDPPPGDWDDDSSSGWGSSVSDATETVREWVSKREAENDAGTQDEPTDRQAMSADDFEEWPDSARRPSDRSSAPDTSDTGAANSGSTPRPKSREEPTRATMADDENSAQADARSGVVSEDDLPTGTVEGATRNDRGRSAHSTPDRDRSDTARERVDSDRQPAARSGTDEVDGDAPTDESPDERVATDDEEMAAEPDHGRVVSEPSGERPSIEELREELNEQFESIKIVRPGQYELNLMELYNREEYIISLQEDGRYVIEVPDAWRDGEE
ncbi:OapC/ArvC family zinc-ribbon domain-containing protein [Halopiger goleimassiliensis]|uniref:OapC/ArvC family zinc-ribbon domain-containing protein n=1 Tax=Halopiger goleimassiliensis TaxID=1293048 RepID=UPI000677F36E|nr:Zn-ribbon containing protein [Halopiger goleimassiliensis]